LLQFGKGSLAVRPTGCSSPILARKSTVSGILLHNQPQDPYQSSRPAFSINMVKTRAPSSCRRCAIAQPIPELPPVTETTFLSKRFMRLPFFHHFNQRFTHITRRINGTAAIAVVAPLGGVV